MTKVAEKNLAVASREAGHSYEEILEILEKDGYHVSKGSLSNWLKDIPLTPEQQKRLEERERLGGAKGRSTVIENRKQSKKQLATGGWNE